MNLELRPIRPDDAPNHHAAEDDLTVRWLSGGRSSVEGTEAYFAGLAENAARGAGKRGFGIWVDNRLAGYVDFDPDVTDGLDRGDVNISYCVQPWARGRGVASHAVAELCGWLADHDVGERAALRIETENTRSVRVADKAGFELVRRFESTTDTDPHGRPATMWLYRQALRAFGARSRSRQRK